MTSDWEHLTRAKNGDEESFVIIFNKYNKMLLRMTSLITGSIDSAKDIAQESFIRLIKKRVKHQDGNFKTYLTTVAYRLALKERYRINKNTSVNEVSIMDNSVSPLDNQINKENQINVFATINSLPKKQKEILVLRFYGNHSYEEIAKITNLPLGTVKSRIYYAVKQCGKILRDKGYLNESLR
jgi:RNA polymerase sigma-70 factor (ECF subfamily)